MLMFILLLILTEVKRKRKRKSTPLKRKINTSIKKPQVPPSPCTPLMVTFLLIQERATSPKLEKPAPLAAQESSWPNTGTDTTVELATPPSRWMQKLLKRTNTS